MRFLIFLSLLLVHTALFKASACPLVGKVIKIADGDTVTILDAKRKHHKIRLAGIDSPERKQPFGNKAKRYLSSIIGGKTICVDWYKLDRYKRKVGKLLLNNRDINFEMVKSGFAWHYKKYQKEQTSQDQLLYSKAETNARSLVIGLWSEPHPIPPSDWRKGIRPTKVTQQKNQRIIEKKRLIQSSNSKLSCGKKRFCTNMSSCEEAQYYFDQCKILRLDGDNDGIPCENICR